MYNKIHQVVVHGNTIEHYYHKKTKNTKTHFNKNNYNCLYMLRVIVKSLIILNIFFFIVVSLYIINLIISIFHVL